MKSLCSKRVKMENEKANPKDDDEATVSSSVEDGESSSDYDDMPLFKYARLVGSLAWWGLYHVCQDVKIVPIMPFLHCAPVQPWER